MAPPSKRKALTIPPIAPEHLIDDDLSYDDLLDRKTYLQDQLQAIALPTPPTAANRRRKPTSADSNSNSTSTIIPMIEKTSDVHRDFLLKEMQWLATDFMAERKRHKAASRKLANGLMSHIQSAATRRQRELDQAVAKRKATAHRIGAKVSRWWTAMDRVVTYQQKAAADQERRAAMNQQLVKLVQQTERYTQSLAHTAETSSSMVTIEQALANATAMRRTKRKIRDYGRLQLAPEDTELYGESTTEDSGSDASYSATDDEEDDETTLRQAEAEETRLRLHKENATFVADPDELRKLQEESELPIEKVLERLAEEAEEVATEKEEDEPGGGEEIQVQPRALKRTKRQRQVVRFSPASDPGNDADDDGDASDVEDFVDDQEDEFVGEEPEPDDETTMAQEEALPTELSPAQEIQLLQQESEVSVEELRKKYAGILGGNEDAENDDEDKKVSVNEDLDDGDMQEADEEFQPSGDTVDDETTMIAEENLGRDMSYQDEIALLQRESEMSVEELRKMYGGTSDGDGEDMENVKEEDAPGKEYHSLTSTLAHRDDEEEDEFKPAAGDGVDDETTMEAEEKLGRDMSYKDEIELLKRESEMSFEELRQMYSGPLDNKSTIEGDGQSQSQPHDDERENKEYHSLAGNLSRETDGAEEEFVPESQDVVDDETTIAAEERLGRDMTYQEELSLLKRENEMSVEELREMYTRMERDDEAKGASADDDDSVSLRSMNAEGGDGKAPGDGNAGAYMESADDAENDLSSENESDSNSGRKRRRRDSNSGDGKAKHARLEHDSEGQASDAGKRAMDALEASAELARRTRASRPFLLAPWVKLREYQQIGLNWLVSMQTRRLNGILADGAYTASRLPLAMASTHTHMCYCYLYVDVSRNGTW